jgi:ABC-type glutathione transport system ATPase component
LLAVEALSIGFAGGDVVRDISFAIGAGETLALVGESGCGKSLTSLSVIGLLPPAARVAGRIASLHDDTARYERLVQKARETVIRQHDLQKNGDRLLECFRTCIAGRLAASK